MATLTLTMNPCGASSTSQKIYYGKAKIVQGDPLSGSGWILHTGAPIAAGDTEVVISSLDDNVDYIIKRYCTCPASGDIGPENFGPINKKACPTFGSTFTSSTTIGYNLLPAPAITAAGTWMDKTVVSLYLGTTFLQKKEFGKSSSPMVGTFSGLNNTTSYTLKVTYETADGSRIEQCITRNVTTRGSCVAPTVTLTNVQSTSMSANWSVPESFNGDTYNVAVNGTTVISGLPTSANSFEVSGLTQNTLYQISVQRNCAGGGQSTGTASASTGNAPCTIPVYNVITVDPNKRNQAWTICPYIVEGTKFIYSLYGHEVQWGPVPPGVQLPGSTTPNFAAERLVFNINNTTAAQWNSAGQFPGGFKPVAALVGYAKIEVTIDSDYEATLLAYQE